MDVSPGRLLVVDDDENNRDMLSRRLERRGYTVTVAGDGQSALKLVAAQTFDLVILDVMMPGISGIDVLKTLRQSYAATALPVIMATARTDRADVIEALGFGASDYVTKPLDFPVVVARVETQLAHKRAVDRIIALEEDLKRQNAELENANERMRRDLTLAAKMQQSLLPAERLLVPGVEFAWAYKPCDELGGDILNVFPLGSDHVGMYLLDVSGHGVPAALLSVQLCRLLAPVQGHSSIVQRRCPGGFEPTPPADVVAELNRRFPMSELGQYFTVLYGVLDLRTREFRYTSAGHPPLLKLSGDGKTEFVEARGFAVGWIPEADFHQTVVPLAAGDRLYVYSDGVTEAFSPDREQFGVERLAEAAAHARASALESSLCSLQNAAAAFRGNESFDDDVSLLALEVVG